MQDFRLPETYQLAGGETIHASRVIRFDGYKLPWDEFQRNNYWGGSIAERVYEDVLNTKITTQSISSMIFEASVDVIGVKDLFEKIMNKSSLNSLITRFQLANMTKSINKALVIDQENETFTKVATNFSGLPNLISEFLSVVAAAADIPATRMLGQSAKGFSATGEGDLNNYYDMVSSKQETDLYDALGKLDAVLVPSVFGRPVDDWDFEFNPLQQMDEKEIAEINKLDTESARSSFEAGAITLSQWSAQLLKKGTYPTLDSNWVEALEEVEQSEAELMAEQLKAEPEPIDEPEPIGEPVEPEINEKENGEE
jgi:phage-related protein (TIGR01555 family)